MTVDRYNDFCLGITRGCLVEWWEFMSCTQFRISLFVCGCFGDQFRCHRYHPARPIADLACEIAELYYHAQVLGPTMRRDSYDKVRGR